VIVSCTFFVFYQCVGHAGTQSARKITFLFVTLRNIHRLKKITHRLSNKPFLIWLLETSAHLKYVATLLCNLSLMACFAGINVSQGSVATHARCGGILNIHLTANLPRSLPVIFFKNRLRFDRSIVMSLWPCFGPPCRGVYRARGA